MYDTPRFDTATGRIDPDHREHSPSTGTEEIAEILHTPRAHAVEPVDADRFVAMIRTDRPEEYRRKHRRGVSS